MDFILKHKLTIVGIALGAMGGYLYYYFIGCVSGTCAITSKPMNSTLYGALMGWLLFNMFKKEKRKQQYENPDRNQRSALRRGKSI